MRTLVIDSATQACSVALFEGEPLTHLGGACELIGRGHAERLVPMIAELPDKGRADRIAVSLGPGSFTGVRIGLAAARALGLAWKAQVLGYPTLALVAARSRKDQAGPVTVCMAGGHGQWFVQNFSADGLPEDDVRSLTPEQAVEACRHRLIAGSEATALAALGGPDRTAVDLLPDARGFPSMDHRLLTTRLSPLYGRGPDARLPA